MVLFTDPSTPVCWILMWSLVGIQVCNHEEKSLLMLGRFGGSWLGMRSPLLLQDHQTEEFPSRMPACTLRGGMRSPRDGNVSLKFPGVHEWVSDSWAPSPWWAARLLITTFLRSPFQRAISWNLFQGVCVFVSLCIRLQCSWIGPAVHGTLHLGTCHGYGGI